MIESLILDYESRELDSPSKQAEYILSRIVLLLESGKKVAIIYSANNEQAEKIYKSYQTRKLAGIIHGKNQAATFEKITENKKLQSKDGKINENFHILPIATILVGGHQDPVDIRHIIRDLTNIQLHLEQDWYVLVLTNSMNLRNRENQKYQIGGGRAASFYSPHLKNIPFENDILSQGHFVEKCIDIFFQIYGKPFMALPSEPKQSKDYLKNKLDNILLNYQAQLLTEEDQSNFKFISKNLKFDSKTLEEYVTDALKLHHVIPSSSNPIIKVYFSPSYHLRIDCTDEKIEEVIINKLSAYGAEKLNEIRGRQIDSKKKHDSTEKEKFTISIFYEDAYRFLEQHCKIPVHSLVKLYSQRIKSDRQTPYHNIIITGHYIIFDNNRPYTFKEAVKDKKFGSPYRWRRLVGIKQENAYTYPNNVIFPLNCIMKKITSILDLKDQKLEASSSNYYNYRCFQIETVSNNTVETLNKLAKSLATGNSDHHFSDSLQQMAWYFYNTLSNEAFKLHYNLTFEEVLKKKSDKVALIGDYHSKLMKYIINDVLSVENERAHYILKYWLYTQIALIAYLKGNIYLFVAVAQSIALINHKELNDTELFIYDYFPEEYQAIIRFLHNECFGRAGEIKSTYLVRMSSICTYYFGVSLPILQSYLYIKEQESTKKSETISVESMQEFLEPVLKAISSIKIEENNLVKIDISSNSDNQKMSNKRAHFKNVVKNNEATLKQYANILCTQSIHLSMLTNVLSIFKILNVPIDASEHDSILLNIFSMRGSIFSSDTDIIQKVIDSTNLNLFEAILKYNLVRNHLFEINVINQMINNISVPSIKKSARELINKYLTEHTDNLSLEENHESTFLANILSNSYFATSSWPWYTDADITSLIDIKINRKLYNKKNCNFLLLGGNEGRYTDEDNNTYFVVITPAIDTLSYASPLDFYLDKTKQQAPDAGRKDDRRDVFDELLVHMRRPGELHIKILFPYNITQSHWLTGEIKIHRYLKNNLNQYLIEVSAHDPMGGGAVIEENYNTLCSTIRKKILQIDPGASPAFNSCKSQYVRRQHIEDGDSCGAIVVEDVYLRANGASLNRSSVYSKGAMNIRSEHIALIKMLDNNDATRKYFLKRHDLKNNHSQIVSDNNSSDISKNDKQNLLIEEFMHASFRGNIKLLQLLLTQVDVNTKDILGATALHWAAGNNQHEVVQLLLKAKANSLIADTKGQLPLDWTTEDNESANLLRSDMSTQNNDNNANSSSSKKNDIKDNSSISSEGRSGQVSSNEDTLAECREFLQSLLKEGYKFNITRPNINKLQIQYTEIDSTLDTPDEVRIKLTNLSKKLLANFKKLNIKCNCKPDWKNYKLIIEPEDVNNLADLNKAASTLENLGVGNFNKLNQYRSIIFFPQSSAEIKPEQSEEIHISCQLQ